MAFFLFFFFFFFPEKKKNQKQKDCEQCSFGGVCGRWLQQGKASGKALEGSSFGQPDLALSSRGNWALLPRGESGHKNVVSALATFDGTNKAFASGWYLDVRVKLQLKSAKDPTATNTPFKEQVFRFSEKEPVHGWEEFVPSDLILKDKENLYTDQNGVPSFLFEVQIVREKGCSGAFRAGFQHDSFKATGYCGLKNQGATCYLNSLLQALYWIAPFRTSVYRLPTNDDQPNASIPLALQRLFYRLQFLNAPVSTTELTASFGWGTKDVFMQHDVQELNRVLQDKIEEKMRGTSEEGTVAKIFRGKMVSYIKCLKVEYESKREEEFYDVSLVVKGCKNVYESFDKYTETELLNGPNQYRAEGHGLQDAEKGVRFIQFPPVLHLQLKRFDFDLQSLRNYKIHSRYEFPRELDLGKYVDANSPHRDDPAVYVLQGVMVHSGTAGGGHYYAYFRPTARKRWYKFNDMRVTKATSEEAIEDNFGVNSSGSGGGGGQSRGLLGSMLGGPSGGKDPYTSAYMLQYVRKDHFQACVADVPMSVVPHHINLRFQEEEKERERKKAEKLDAHLYTYVKVFDEADLAAHAHFDLMDFERVRSDRVFRVKRTSTVKELKENYLMAAYNVDNVDKIRLRQFTRRRNATVRASKVVDNDAAEISSLQNRENADGVKFLVELSTNKQEPFFDTPGEEECQLFFKFYDPAAKKLRFVTRLRMAKHDTPLSVEQQLRRIAGVSPDAKLMYFEEIRTDNLRVDPVDPSKTMGELELGNGDILVFQTVLPDAKPFDPAAAKGGSNGEFVNALDMDAPYAPSYYQFLKESVSVKFKRLHGYETDPGISIMCVKSNNYEQIQDLLAKHLPIDVCDNPRKLEFTGQSSFSFKPAWNGPFSRSANLTLNRMLTAQYGTAVDTIFYEVQPFPLDEMASKTIIDVQAFDLKQHSIFSHAVVVDKTATVGDLLAIVRKQCRPELAPEQQLRALITSNSRITRILKDTDLLADNVSRVHPEVLVEFVTEEEATLEKGDRLVCCAHAEFDTYLSPFGTPFLMVVRRKETIASVRARLAKRLELSAEEIGRWKLGVAEGGFLSGFKPLVDTDHLDPSRWTSNSYLALTHTNTRKGTSYYGARQGGVVIRDVKTPEVSVVK